MKILLNLMISVSILTGCSSGAKISYYPDSTIGKVQKTANFSYYWILVNGMKKAILVRIPGKGKSGPYKLELLIDMNGEVKEIKTVGHPGRYGAKADANVVSHKGRNLGDELKIDTTSGATISTKNAARILQRNRAKILNILKNEN